MPMTRCPPYEAPVNGPFRIGSGQWVHKEGDDGPACDVGSCTPE
jgi:hypothetical protein